MKKYLILLLIFSFISCRESKITYESRARELMGQQKYDEAIRVLNSALNDHKDDPDLYNIRGAANYQLKKYKDALADFELAIRLDSSNYRPFYNSGNCFFGLRDYENALAHYLTAIELEPYNEDIYINLANTYFELNDYERAISNYELALQLNDSSYLANFNLAKSLIGFDSLGTAVSYLKKCTQIAPHNGEAFYFLAFANYISGSSDDYCLLYQTSINLGFAPDSDVLANECREK